MTATPEQIYARTNYPPDLDLLTDAIDGATADLVNEWQGHPVVSASKVARLLRLTQELKDRTKDLDEKLEDLMWELGG